MKLFLRAAIAASMLALPVAAIAGAVPAATPTPLPLKGPFVLPSPPNPKVPLHSWFVVEVNKHGQVARVNQAQWSDDAHFNHETYGNVVQMWIRKPDGTALVGLYKVSFDYDPKTLHIARRVALVKAGGNWGDLQGEVYGMMDDIKKAHAGKPTPKPARTP